MQKKLLLAFAIFFSLFSTAQKKNLKTDTLKILGNCEMCKDRIEKTAINTGAYKADWVIATHLLSVTYDSTKTSLDKIEKKIAAAGHDTKNYKAKENTYKNLPACCHYDRQEAFSQNQTDSITTLASASIKAADSAMKSSVVFDTKELHNITGIVLEENKKGKLNPLPNATIMAGPNSTHTDSLGVFQLQTNLPVKLIVSYVGYKADTLMITTSQEIKVILKNSSTVNLKEVVLQSRNASTYISTISLTNTMNMGIRELTKAACCNLSESFETNPSIDVSYADAVIGVKQIQLLGLSGSNTQLLNENIPYIRGLAGSYGLTFVPGPWIESIQVTKGAGSVVNGFESIAGQINIEEKKPDRADKLFINGYANNFGRLEATINTAKILSPKWSTALMAHVNGVVAKTDNNHDGFLDMPTGRQFNFYNRWLYANTKGWVVNIGAKILFDNRRAGQTNFNPDKDFLTTNSYGVGLGIQQYHAYTKVGYIFPQHKYKSIGLLVNGGKYINDSYFGLRKYDANQGTLSASIIYQSIIGVSAHKFRTGFSFIGDKYLEKLSANTYSRNENIPGAFFEYTYSPGQKFSAIAGLRGDIHNRYGFELTPRLHLKYDFTKRTNLRLSAGSGWRTANVFAENSGVFVSSRQINFVNTFPGDRPEKAWNYGLNFVHNFTVNGRKGSISFDAYRTDFKNQVVADLDESPQAVSFYNLAGKSFSNSLQTEFNYEAFRKFELRLAYRWLDVKTTYANTLLEKPLIAKHRAFINLAYETDNEWKLDFTTQWLSSKRLPNTSTNPLGKQLATYSPSYIQMAAQVSKKISTKWEVYLGGENLTNYMQPNPILDAANPFGQYFDGSMIWGPVNGRTIYTGFRFKIR